MGAASAFALLAPGWVGASTAVSFGDTLSVPGQYHLQSDITGSGDAITITANDVHLNLRGHSIIGDGVANQVGILVTGTPAAAGGCTALVRRAHINNGTITGFAGSGIRIHCVADSHVNGVTLNNNHHGLDLLSSTGNKINNNDVVNNDSRGLFIVNSHSNQVIANDVSFNRNGTSVFNSSDNRFIGNLMNGNGFFGMFLEGTPTVGGAHRNTIRNNTFNANGATPGACPFFGGGLLIGTLPGPNTADNLVHNNTALANQCGWDVADLNVLNAFGAMCLNTWENNEFDAVFDFGGPFGVGDPDCIR